MKPYQLNSRYTWKKLASGLIILDLQEGTYFTLNETAAKVWEGVMAGSEDEAIAASLSQEYSISSEQAKADVEEALAKLVQEGVLEKAHA